MRLNQQGDALGAIQETLREHTSALRRQGAEIHAIKARLDAMDIRMEDIENRITDHRR